MIHNLFNNTGYFTKINKVQHKTAIRQLIIK